MRIDPYRSSMAVALLAVLLAGCPGDFAISDAAADAAAKDVGRADASFREASGPLPDGQPLCPPRSQLEGSYQGTFDGTLTGVMSATVSGTVSFTLVKQGTDEFVTISGGKLVGTAQGQFPYTADLGGTA